ncbi:MAG: hypothetical protein LQ351_006280 [Letrouitia transgressa]|nr:MAG: hypothetical protein LQ351_006280 [Letrouitia transgressa]
MHATIVRVFALFALPALIAATCGSCIGDSEILIYDEGATNGSTKPEVTNIEQLEGIISASAYGGGGVTNVTYSIVFTFHTCDRIALRWQEKAITTDNVGYGSSVKAGKHIQFKGTDLLTVDLASRKVKEVTTSADLLNYYRALDYDLGVWSK